MGRTGTIRKEFWRKFYYRLAKEETSLTPVPDEPRGEAYVSTEIPEDGFRIVYFAYKGGDHFDGEYIGYALNVPETDLMWQTVANRQDDFEDIVGEKSQLAGPDYKYPAKNYTVRVRRGDSIFSDNANWQEYYKWFIDQGKRCRTFVQYVDALMN